MQVAQTPIAAMAEMMKTPKKAMHPSYPRMVCESMHALDKEMMGKEHHGHSMQSIKKYMGEHYKVIGILRN